MANRFIPNSLTASDKPSWPIRALRSLGVMASQRIEPEIVEYETNLTFDRSGVAKLVRTKDGRFQFGELNGNQFVINRPSADQPIDPAKALANNKGFVYAAVNAIAREVMSVEWQMFQQSGKNVKELADHACLDLLDHVNDSMMGIEFKYLLSASLLLTGNAYVFLEGVNSDTDQPKAIHLMPTEKVRPAIDRRTWPYSLMGYKLQLENSTIAFQPYEVIHFRLPNPADFTIGISPLEAGAEYIDNDKAAMEFNRKFFRNGARPVGFLETDFVSETQLDVLKTSFEDMHGGLDNMNRVGALPKGVKWNPTGANPKDMDFKNLSEDMKDRILAMFGVSKTILGTAESDTNRACYDDRTEVLTENGWKKYWEVKDGERIAEYDGEKNVIRFAVPEGKYVYEYKGTMLHFENSKMDIMVTPDHRMWYRPDHKGAKYRIAQAQKLPKIGYFKAAAPLDEGEEIAYFSLPAYNKGSHPERVCRGYRMDDWLEFLGYVISEGGVSSVPKQRIITLYQKKQPHLRKIRACLKRLKRSGCLNYGEYQTPGEAGKRFNVYGAPVVFWMHEHVGRYSDDKHIPDFVFNLSARQRRILFDALMVGDGSIDPRKNRSCGYYSTTSHQLADDVQRLALSLGIQSHAGVHYEANGNRKICYRVMFDFGNTEQQLDWQHRDMRHEVEYDGVVWCFKTSTGLFVTRRNGKIALQGNTAETADYVFSKRVVKPHLTLILGFLNRYLVPRYGDDVYLTAPDPVPEDREFRTKEMEAAMGNAPVMTPNEAREHYLGLGPVEGGDALMGLTLQKPLGSPEGDTDPNPDASKSARPQSKSIPFRPARTKASKFTRSIKNVGQSLAEGIVAAITAFDNTKTKAFSPEQDAAFHAKVSDRVASAEKEIADAIKKANADQKQQVLDNLAKAVEKSIDAKTLFDIAAWTAVVAAALTPILTSLFESQAKDAAEEIGTPDLNPLDDEAVATKLTDAIEKASESYETTIQGALAKRINEGLEAGKPLADIAKDVDEVYEGADDYGAMRVAKTEAFRTANAALNETWAKSGVVKTVKWYTTSGDPCPFCNSMNGKSVATGSTFVEDGTPIEADGEKMTVDYGDVDFPPLHPNCACITRPDEINI